MSQPADQFVLPDLYAVLPFEGGQNPFFDVVGKESRDWVNSYNILPHHRQADFTSCELFASHCYPYAPYDMFRICADFLNVLSTLDEVSDVQDSKGARDTIHLFVRVLRNDPGCDDGSSLAKMLIDFVERFRKFATPDSQRRLYQASITQMEAVQKEAEYRESGKVVDMEYYHYVRRGSSAALSCFTLFEPALGINFPDKVVDHPAFEEISIIGLDLYCWSNDLYSFNMERSRGIDASNIITILMKHKGYTLQQAADHVGEVFTGLVGRLVQARQNFPRFGQEIDSAVSKYIDAVEVWVVGFIDWSFVTDRYFGQMGEEVKKTRIVKLFSRKSEL